MHNALMLLSVLVLASCAPSYDQPLDPVWGKQPCAHCAMLVTEARFAAQLTTAAPERIWFDDIGCLVAYISENKPKVQGIWVRDADAPRWLAAKDAHYQDGAKTPMDFGFVAHALQGVDFATMQQLVLARIAEKEQARDHR